MQGEVLVMFEMVAVGAMARTLLLRMPWAWRSWRAGWSNPSCRRGDIDGDAALLLEEVDGVLREEAAVPLASPCSEE